MSDFLKTDIVYRLCNEHQYFTCGSNAQYEKMFQMLKDEVRLTLVATAIWICSNTPKTINDITIEIANEFEKYNIEFEF